MPTRYGKNTKAETIREQIIKNNRARRAFPIDAEYSFSVFEDRVTRKPRPEQIAPIIAKISKVVRVVPKIFSMNANLVGRGVLEGSPNVNVTVGATLQGVGTFLGLAKVGELLPSSGSFVGVGDFSALANRKFDNQASLSGVGDFSALANLFIDNSSSMVGSGDLVASGSIA
jgi:hypothetical protein